jgi:PAS domain S-box-containing protein
VPRTSASRANQRGAAAPGEPRATEVTESGPPPSAQLDDQVAELREKARALRQDADGDDAQLRPLLEAVFTELDLAIELIGKHEQDRDDGAHARSITSDTERRLLRAVFQEVPAPIFLLERDGSIRRVNRQAATLLGTEPGSETGKPFTSLVDLRDRSAVRGQLTALVRTGRPRQTRCSLLSTTGKVRTALTIDLVERPGESGPLIMAVIGPAIMPQPPRDPSTSTEGHTGGAGHDIAAVAQRFDLISAATRLLLENAAFGESLMLRRCASLLAAALSAWVIVDVEDEGVMRRAFVASPTVERFADLAQAIEDCDPEAGSLPLQVHETGRSRLIAEEPDKMALGSASPGVPVLTLLNATSALCTPLTDGERRYGTLTLTRGSEAGAFAPAELELVEEISQQLAVAIKIGRMFLRRSVISEALQASLLPREIPVVPGTDIATGYVPCAEELGVGGDFYDVYPSADSWGLVIGDVGGRGEEAAAATATARYTIRVLAHWNPQPTEVLRMANEVMAAAYGAEQFATAIAAHLSWHGTILSVRYSTAGHPGPILVRPDHRVRVLTSGGMPLGLFGDARPTAEEIDLEPGDILLFHSDGVTAARNADGVYFETRISDELARLAGRPASEVISAIRECVLEFCESDLRDDVTMLALRVLDQTDQVYAQAANGARLRTTTLQV